MLNQVTFTLNNFILSTEWLFLLGESKENLVKKSLCQLHAFNTLSCFVMRREHLQPVKIWDGHHSNVLLVYYASFVVWGRVRFSEVEEERAEAVKSKIWGQLNPSNRGLCSLGKGILHHHKTLEFVKLWTRNSEYTHLLRHHILMLFSIDGKKIFFFFQILLKVLTDHFFSTVKIIFVVFISVYQDLLL